MCGIVGYWGERSAGNILLQALRNLEYRGYDSVGMCTSSGKILAIRKDIGKVEEVNRRQSLHEMPGNIGIAHTRWATTGKVTKENAHPHTDCTKSIAVVHNGIIENYEKIRERLKAKGHAFQSETDTETIAHLLEESMHLGIEKAMISVAKGLEGRNAFVALFGDEGVIAGARKGSPLIMGVGEGEYFIASDIPAFLEHTKKVMYIDDGQMVIINNGIHFFDIDSQKSVEKRIVEIELDMKQAEKGDYEHFLIKEIMEQKDTLFGAINQDEGDIRRLADEINKAFGVFFIGAGTAGRVGLMGEYIFSKIAKKHVNFVLASEFPSYEHFLTSKTLLIPISQSGETADVMKAVEVAKKKGVKVVSIINVKGSTLDRTSDHSFLVNSGIEKAVASTKATTGQLAIVFLLAYACAGKLEEGKRLLIDTASEVNDMLNPRYEAHIKRLAKKIGRKDHIYIIGRGLNYPVALEAAIKITEVSCIHAEGFAGGELKHYSLALISDGVPCIAFVANDETKADILNNVAEVKARGGYIIGVSPEKHDIFDYWLKVPDVGNTSPIVNIIPVQMLAYHLGLERGMDIDYSRNLAKSVTVL